MDEHAQVRVMRNGEGWTAAMRLAFSAFDRSEPPIGEVWAFNIVRLETHRAKYEHSCWTHYYPVLADLPAMPRMGRLIFDESAPLVRFIPHMSLLIPVSNKSAGAISVANDARACCIRPDRLVTGENIFSIQLHGNSGYQECRVTLRAFYGDSVFSSAEKRLQAGEAEATEIKLDIQPGTDVRVLDLELAVTDNQTGRDLFRAYFLVVPVVSPFSNVDHYEPKIVEDEASLWRLPRSSPDDWVMRDYGPMLMTEYYPISLAEAPDGLLYGGTFPGGRLFSFHPGRGEVRDLGSPCFPLNHTRHILVRPDGLVFGVVNRSVFVFDPRTGKSLDLGEPVPGEPYTSLNLTAIHGNDAYGCHKGQLFQLDPQEMRITIKGAVEHDGQSWIFHSIIADGEGNLLAALGPRDQTRWRLGRYKTEGDALLLSEFDFEGLLFNGPAKDVYLLCRDGRLYRWDAKKDSLILKARYATEDLGVVRFAALRSTGELIAAYGSIREGGTASVLVLEPGEREPVEIGCPVPGFLYLNPIISVSDDTVYGLAGSEMVYGLLGKPVHVYSIVRK